MARSLLAAALTSASVMAAVTFVQTGEEGVLDLSYDPPAPSTATCAATIDDWMSSSIWPEEEILIGDQIYSRARLWSLVNSRGNAVADLALVMATAQLNVAAGALPSTDVIEALFKADQWLLDEHEDAQQSQLKFAEIQMLVSALADFNDWAASASDCAPGGGVLALR